MGIDTGIGQFNAGFLQLCIKGSNIVPSNCKILLVGQKTDNGTAATDTVIQVIGQEQADAAFGPKSNLANMVKEARCSCASGIYAIAVDGVGNNAEFEIPVVVDPITEGGTITLSALGCTLTATALIGDAAADVAQALADAVNAKASFPYIATVSGDNVVLAAANLGEVGNQLTFTIENEVTGATVGPQAQTTVGAGVPDSTNAISALGRCCYTCIAYEGVDSANIDIWKTYTESTFDCGPQQCMSHVYHGYVGATAADIVMEVDSENCRSQVFIPIKEGYKYASWQFAAAWAARSCCACCEDPGRPAVRDNGILGCLTDSTSCDGDPIWTNDELEALATAGAAIWDVNASGQLQIELNYTTWKQDSFGNNDITWQKVETACAVRDFLEGLRGLISTNYSSAKLFDDGTKLPVGQGKAVTPRIVRNELIAYMVAEEGLTLDVQTNPNDVVTVMRNDSDPDRLDFCFNDLKFVNSLLRFAGCVDVNVSV